MQALKVIIRKYPFRNLLYTSSLLYPIFFLETFARNFAMNCHREDATVYCSMLKHQIFILKKESLCLFSQLRYRQSLVVKLESTEFHSYIQLLEKLDTDDGLYRSPSPPIKSSPSSPFQFPHRPSLEPKSSGGPWTSTFMTGRCS